MDQHNLKARLCIRYGTQHVDVVYSKILSAYQQMPMTEDEKRVHDNVVLNLTAIVLAVTKPKPIPHVIYAELEPHYAPFRDMMTMPMAQRDGFANMAAGMMLAKDFVITQELALAATRAQLTSR